MIDLNLTGAEQRAFNRALVHSHQARTRVWILDRDEKVLHELPDCLLSGSVDIAKAPVTRSLDIDISDPDRRFGFIPQGPQDYALFADNFIRVSRGVYVDALSRWVDVPVFTGPISRVEPDGAVIKIQAQGKESRGLDPALAWKAFTVPKGVRITEAIRRVMREQGERRFDIPNLRPTLRKPVSVGKQTEPWKVARKLANSLDRQLFYDGRGMLRLRTLPRANGPHWTFRDGVNGNITARPQRSFDIARVRNTVVAVGPKPEGKKKRLVWVAQPNGKHPLSAQSLSRNGEPLFLVSRIEMAHASRIIQVRRRAERELEDLLRSEWTITFEAFPAYHLEPGDLIVLDEDGERTSIRLNEFSLPLTGDVMSVGSNRLVGKGKK